MIEKLTKILRDHPALVATLADASFADALADLTTEGVARYLLDLPDFFFTEALERVAEFWEQGWRVYYFQRRYGSLVAPYTAATTRRNSGSGCMNYEVSAESFSGVIRALWVVLLEEAVKPSDTGTGYAMPEVVEALIGGGKETIEGGKEQ